MAIERRQLVLAAAVIALAIVGYRAWRGTSAAPAFTSNGSGAAAATAGSRPGAAKSDAPDVHLDALDRERPKPGGPERDLFRFKPKAPPPPPPAPARGAGPGGDTAVVGPPAPTGPPPPPPINLKFIGVIDPGGGRAKIAVLTDGVGPPIHGVEGGTVAGKYKILRIGAESIEMAYLDGRGRQTIRLSGS